MVERNYIGKPIRSLQTMLRTLALVNEELEALVPDGIYGENTKRAVTSFQRAYALPQTGETDLETWEMIVEAFDHHRIDNGYASPLHFHLQPGQIILPGEENQHLYARNGVLQALSKIYHSMPMAESGSTHTDYGTDAVRWVQERSNLEPTGCIDRQTWRMIAGLYRATIGDGTSKRG